MKRLLLVFLVAISVLSCSAESEGTQFFISTVEEVTMASSYKVDSTSKIMIKYKRPTDCHLFNGFYYMADNFDRNVAIQFAKVDESDCDVDETVYEIPLNFKPEVPGTYHFKFWHDRDVNGVDIYIEADAVVPE